MPFPSPKPEVLSEEECTICHEPLILPNNDDDPFTPSYEIDDVELRCGHHFHMSCIMESALSSPSARYRCATCAADVRDGRGQYMVGTKTENGLANSVDLGRRIDNEAPLRANPDAERAQLFLSLMSQMDFAEAETLLKGEGAGGMGAGKLSPNVTYEVGGQTAMHMAAYNDDVEGIQLLLRYGADKGIKDGDGQTALDCAKDAKAKAVIALLKN